jgi:biopolymer transport protein ExbD
MAISFAKHDDEYAEAHEINVTPFIDVMLVLLIIFMVAAPLATVDISVNLPSSTSEQQARPDKPIFVTFKADRSFAVGDDQVARADIAAALDAASGSDREQRVFLRADQSLAYGEVMEVMNLLRNAGYLRVALVALESRSSP